MSIEAARLHATVTADTDPAERELRGFSRRAQSTVEPGMRTAGEGGSRAFLGGFGGALLGADLMSIASFGIRIGRGLVGGITGALQDYAQTGSLKMQLQSMVGLDMVKSGMADDFAEGFELAAVKAEELYGWVRQLAIKSPFRAQDIASVQQMAMNMGWGADEAKRMTEGLVDWAAATGRSGPDIEGVARAIGQIGMKGKVSMEELQQLGERGVPGLQILADEAGKTTGEMQKLIESGQVDVDWAMETLVGWTEQFDGAAESAGGTWSGLLSSLEDIKEFAMQDLLGPTFDLLQPHVQTIVDLLTSPTFQRAIKDLGEQLAAWAGVKLDGLAGAIQEIVDIWSTPLPKADGLIMERLQDGWTMGALTFPDPEQGRADVDKWAQTFAVITGWDTDTITRVLDTLFPERGGAKERQFLLPEQKFGDMNWISRFIESLGSAGEKRKSFGSVLFAGISASLGADINAWAAEVGKNMADFLKEVFNRELRQGMAESARQFIEVWRITLSTLGGVIATEAGKFVEVWQETFRVLGEWLTSNPLKPVVDWMKGMVEPLKEAWPWVTLLFETSVLTPIVDWWKGLVESLTPEWQTTETHFAENSLTPIVDWVKGMIDPLRDAWEAVKAWFRDNVLFPTVSWPGGGAPAAVPATGSPFPGGAPFPGGVPANPTAPEWPIDITPPLPDGMLGPSSFGGRGSQPTVTVYATVREPYDIPLLAQQVAKMIRQGRV